MHVFLVIDLQAEQPDRFSVGQVRTQPQNRGCKPIYDNKCKVIEISLYIQYNIGG